MKKLSKRILTPTFFLLIGFVCVVWFVASCFLPDLIFLIPPIYAYTICNCVSVACFIISVILAIIKAIKKFSITPKTFAYIGAILLGLGLNFIIFAIYNSTLDFTISTNVLHRAYDTYFIVTCAFFCIAIIYKIVNITTRKNESC